MRAKTLMMLLVIALFAFAATGCGSDDSGDDPTDNNPALSEQEDPNGEQPSDSSSTKLALSADPDGALKYNTTKLNAKPGNITIDLTNESSTPHDVAVSDDADKELGKSETITGSSTSLELTDVKAGDYTFFCTVPGHEAAGMKGELTVR